MPTTASVNLVEFKAGMIRLKRLIATEPIMTDAGVVCDKILRDARESPTPTREGLLRASASRDRFDDRTWRLGFNRIYATFQDQPTRDSGVVEVVPRTKKWLFIPMTPAARKHIPGANPLKEGLTFGGFRNVVGPGSGGTGMASADYLLARRSLIRIKKYGSDRGPSHYFSETFRRWQKGDRAIRALAKIVEGRLKREAKGKTKP